MKNLVFLFIYVIVVACHGKTDSDNPKIVESIHYPLLIDGGKKIVYQRGRMTPDKGMEVYLDTVTFTKGELYQQDSILHPLLRFYLSYSEWETISCIIAVDEDDYWNKAMIGLIEKSGNLRISYNGLELHLAPTMPVKMEEGEWLGTFKSDSLSIEISARLEQGRNQDILTGSGELVFITPAQTITEAIYLSYRKE